MVIRMSLVVWLALELSTAGSVVGEDWRGFRNDGRSVANSSTLPLNWNESEGIAWQIELPGYGQSSPIYRQGMIYLTVVEGAEKETISLQAYEAATGTLAWKHDAVASSKARNEYRVSRAAPTALLDDQGIYAFFESGDLLAVDFTGKPRWSVNLGATFGPFENHHGLGASPCQNESLIFVNLEHRGPSYLVAIEKQSGKIVWQAPRPSGMSWSSPVIVKTADGEQLIVSSGGRVDGYDSSNGQVLWSLEGLAGNTIPSPTPLGDHLLIGASPTDFDSEGSTTESNCCLKLSSSTNAPEVVWRAKRARCHYASPVEHQGVVYYINSVGVIHAVDAATGESLFDERWGAACWATPIAASDYLFVFAKDGRTLVMQSGKEFKPVAENRLWNPDSPPMPESYRETPAPETAAPMSGEGRPSGAARGGEGGGSMVERLLAGDADADGKLSKEELPAEMQRAFERQDLNQDGMLDRAELEAMEKAFRARREGSRQESRDPIVYGVAAGEGRWFVRTGTRLYAIEGTRSTSSNEEQP